MNNEELRLILLSVIEFHERLQPYSNDVGGKDILTRSYKARLMQGLNNADTIIVEALMDTPKRRQVSVCIGMDLSEYTNLCNKLINNVRLADPYYESPTAKSFPFFRLQPRMPEHI